jgi:flagellar motor protein MotB
MKRNWALGWVLGSVGSAALLSGCVTRAEYEEAIAASRRAHDQLTKCKGALRDLRTENQKLRADVQDREGIIGARERALALLRQSKVDLKADFDKLKELYDKAIGRATPTPIGPISILPAAINKALHDFAQANPDLVEYLPKYGMVKLKADLTFAPGSDVVQQSAVDALSKFAAIINEPVAAKFNIYIAGHTDDMPIGKPDTRRRHPDNWYLSVHRAVAVQKALESANLDAKRIGVMGFSEYHPVEPNRPNKRGNKANRRVEIWIVPPDRFLTIGGG